MAEELHFGGAAERLHLSASPVSRTVKELEKELGAELLVRRYHQVELTDAGRTLAAKARLRPILEHGRIRHALRRRGSRWQRSRSAVEPFSSS